MSQQQERRVTPPHWLTVFIDFPEPEFRTGSGFWCAATGWEMSSLRGDRLEFASLLPPTGDGYLRVQRLADGPTRLHLDLHVTDPWPVAELAEGLGAELSWESPHGHLVMVSPGGLVFCLVPAAASQVPGPVIWPGGHASRVAQICIDVPAAGYASEVAFWQTLLGGDWEFRDRQEPVAIGHPAGCAVAVRLQQAQFARAADAHLHLASDDRIAEVERLQDLGAVRRAVRDGWTVMEAPGGMSFCVLDLDPGRI